MSCKGTIWLINKDAAPIEEYGTHLRTVKQAQFFQSVGYSVKIFCSARVHNTGINHVQKGDFSEEMRDNVPFCFIRSVNYGNSGIKRVVAYLLFAFKVYNLRKRFAQPDIIIHTSRIPFDFPIYLLSKKCKSKYVLDITDLWPMEFSHFGFLKEKGFILSSFYKVEKYLYSRADHCVFSMEGCYEYIREKHWDIESGGTIDLSKVHYINNGISISEYHNNLERYKLDDPDILDDSKIKFTYIGAIRKANNLSLLIDAAKELQENKDIYFLIYGDGDDREILKERCEREGITNVLFKEKWLEPQYLPFILSHSSVNLLNYAKGWAPYGGSMNKMFLALASGKPILCNAGMNYSLIRKYGLGIDEYFDNPCNYAKAITEMANYSATVLETIRNKAQEVSKEYDTDVLNKKFSEFCEIDIH